MAPQPEQPLAVLAKGVEPHGHWLVVRPEELVALEVDLVNLAVSGRVATEEYVERS
jgi:hypothetical protein